MATSEMQCCSEGRGRVAELSRRIVHCNVYCCIIVLVRNSKSVVEDAIRTCFEHKVHF